MATAVTAQLALCVRLCSECGEPIPTSRLKAKPNARQCVPCLEALGDVTLTRQFVEQHGQVEKLFKGEQSTKKQDEDDSNGSSEHTVEQFFTTDDEQPKDEVNVSVVTSDVPAHELDELPTVEAVSRRTTPRSGTKERPNYHGVVYFNKLWCVWVLRWWQDGVSRAKAIGSKEKYPTELEASRAAEPLREWFRTHPEVFKEATGRTWFEKEDALATPTPAELRAERQEIEADIVKAKREEGERRVEALFAAEERTRTPKYFAATAAYVLGLYIDHRHSSSLSGNIRAIRFTDASRPDGCFIFQRGTMLDFVSDVDIAARAVLKQPLHIALWRLLYVEARFAVELASKCYGTVLGDMHTILGREFERRGISPTHEYFRPFKAAKS